MNRLGVGFKLLIILLWLSGVFLSAKYIESWRINNQYSELLTPLALDVLKKQTELEIEVFALPDSAAATLVENFLKPLIKELKAVEVSYIDNKKNIELVQQYNIKKQGEMIVRNGDQSFQLSSLSYETFFNGLKRLSQPQNRWIVFLENLSSHSFHKQNGLIQSNSYNSWLNQLMAANYQAVVLPWQAKMKLPNHAKLIILAAPSVALTTDQIQWLENQIVQGRSVLWLTYPKFVTQQPALSLMFDMLHTGAYYQDQLVLKEYPEHLINQSFDRPLDLFEVMPFETDNQPLWVNEQGQVLAATQEIKGLGVAGLSSRLMVIGDSDFLTDQYLISGGNLEMSYRLVDWLLQNDDRIDLPSIGFDNKQLHFNASEILWFAGIMLVLIPLLLLVMAVYLWRKTKS